MFQRVVFLNAPPGAGKDELTKRVCSRMPFHHMKMAAPIRRAIAAQWALTPEEVEWFEANKNKPHPMFGGMSYREAMIDYSEFYMKKTFGRAVFGFQAAREAVRRLSELPIIFSDAGFTYEEQRFIEFANDFQEPEPMDAAGIICMPPLARYLIVCIDRPGCNWDSRHRLKAEDFERFPNPITFVTLDNDGTLAEFLENGFDIIEAWMNQGG